MAKFKKEVSSGGVLYKIENNKLKVALISRVTQRGEKVWCLPKGKVEEKENPEKTALREVKEETGLRGEIVENLGQINYWFYSPEDRSKVFKTVYFYLMRYKSGHTQDHDWEVENARWFDIDEALNSMAYKTEKEMVEKAKKVIESEGCSKLRLLPKTKTNTGR